MLIGSGGREHALAWKLAQSPSCDTLFAAPGNPGIAQEAELADIQIADHGAVINFCAGHDIGLVVVGPEAPLVDGLGDSLRAAGIAVFGPNRNAAQLEGSKGFTKDMCAAANIPTAGYKRHDSKASALAGLDMFKPPYVIKADGLAAGKGVIIAESRAEAMAAIEDMFGGGFGDAGASVVLEEFMTGEEASFFALTDGHDVVAFGSAQDHKRVGDGDIGPNTGGMGAYSPAPVLTMALQDEVMERIIRPTVAYMAAQGMPYIGVLFAGLMLTDEGPKLIEYNARFGDPECQVLMMRFRGDLAALMLAVAKGGLAAAPQPDFAPDYALTIVMAAKGYPDAPQKGGVISLNEGTNAKLFHAGTAEKDGLLIANGGRVLNVTATGLSVTQAQKAAYAAADAINFPSGFYRRDIGWREVRRESAEHTA